MSDDTETQTEMYEQTQAFPRSTLEILEQLRGVHATDLEKAADALEALSDDEKIAKRYDKAEERLFGCRELLRNIDKALVELRTLEGTAATATIVAGEGVTFGVGVAKAAADIVNSGALDTEGMTVTASVSPVVDPITGEVAPGLVADWKCSTCRGDGRLPDKTGGGHHKCKACDGTGHQAPSCDNCTGYGDCNISQPPGSDTMGCGGRTWIHGEMVDELPIEGENSSTGADPEAVVNVWYPGEEHARITDVGEHTHYGEFVADYLATLPPKDAHKNDSLGLYRVVDNLSNECALGVIVDPAEYGSSFWVEAVAKAEEPAA